MAKSIVSSTFVIIFKCNEYIIIIITFTVLYILYLTQMNCESFNAICKKAREIIKLGSSDLGSHGRFRQTVGPLVT